MRSAAAVNGNARQSVGLRLPAQRNVVRLVSEGLADQEIAARLFVSPRTVQSHLTHIYAKLGLTSRMQLADEAARHSDAGPAAMVAELEERWSYASMQVITKTDNAGAAVFRRIHAYSTDADPQANPYSKEGALLGGGAKHCVIGPREGG